MQPRPLKERAVERLGLRVEGPAQAHAAGAGGARQRHPQAVGRRLERRHGQPVHGHAQDARPFRQGDVEVGVGLVGEPKDRLVDPASHGNDVEERAPLIDYGLGAIRSIGS